MTIDHTITRLMAAFPNSFINHNEEFIAHLDANEYFCLGNCETFKFCALALT